MDTQSYDISRMFTTSTGTYCEYSCPYCKCPDGSAINDTEYIEYQTAWDVANGYTSCTSCTCSQYTGEYPGNNDIKWSECDHYPVNYVTGTNTCLPSKTVTNNNRDQQLWDTYQCHWQANYNYWHANGTRYINYLKIMTFYTFVFPWQIYR